MKKLVLIAIAMLVAVGAFATDATDTATVTLTIEQYATVDFDAGAAFVVNIADGNDWPKSDTEGFSCAANFAATVVPSFTADAGWPTGVVGTATHTVGTLPGSTTGTATFTASLAAGTNWWDVTDLDGTGTFTLTISY